LLIPHAFDERANQLPHILKSQRSSAFPIEGHSLEDF
jgi:hypothetical protein